MYTVLLPLKFLGQECAISNFSEYLFCAKASIHLRKSQWLGGNERSFCIFRRIHVRLPLACQVAYECFSFTPVH